MPLFDYYCSKCQKPFEDIGRPQEPAPCPKCQEMAYPKPNATKSYKIHGDNSASITPKKFRV